jgi:hypothetical protein
MLTDELLSYLFDEQPHLLAQAIATWLASSRRFSAFVTTFRDKIRKKLRTAQDEESLLDLRLELETAYLLLRERPLSVVYEPQPSGQIRRPDFAITFTSSLTFMLEVTRLRAMKPEAGFSTRSPNAPTPPLVAERLADVVCSKLSQLLPQRGNILLVGVGAAHLTREELRAVMLRVQQRAERDDSTFLQRHHFDDRSDFFRYYQRLSEILVRAQDLEPTEQIVIWVNPQAKHPLAGKVRTVFYRSQGG